MLLLRTLTHPSSLTEMIILSCLKFYGLIIISKLLIIIRGSWLLICIRCLLSDSPVLIISNSNTKLTIACRYSFLLTLRAVINQIHEETLIVFRLVTNSSELFRVTVQLIVCLIVIFWHLVVRARSHLYCLLIEYALSWSHRLCV